MSGRRSVCAKILQAIITQTKKLGKTAYLFSVDTENNKVVHVNHVSPEFRSKGLDARTWASSIADVLGGKVSSFGVTHKLHILMTIRLGARKIALKVSVRM